MIQQRDRGEKSCVPLAVHRATPPLLHTPLLNWYKQYFEGLERTSASNLKDGVDLLLPNKNCFILKVLNFVQITAKCFQHLDKGI